MQETQKNTLGMKPWTDERMSNPATRLQYACMVYDDDAPLTSYLYPCMWDHMEWTRASLSAHGNAMKVKRNSSVHTNKHGFNLIRRSSEHVQASKAHACKAVASAASDAQAQPNYEIGHRPCFTFLFFQQCYTMHSQLAKFSTITRRSPLYSSKKEEEEKKCRFRIWSKAGTTTPHK